MQFPRLTIRNKLFAVLLCMSICLVFVLSLLMRWSVDRGMLEYVNERERDRLQPVIEVLEDYYEHEQSWTFAKQNSREFKRNIYRAAREHSEEFALFDKQLRERYRELSRLGEGGQKRKPPQSKWLLLDANYAPIFGRIRDRWQPLEAHLNLLPVEYDGNVVAWLATPKRIKLTKLYELSFVKQQFYAFIIISAVVLLLALMVAWPLAQHFLSPIQSIMHTLDALRKGDYHTVSVQRNDEFGELARDVNELSRTLRESSDLRQRWLADISHELRTPVAILRGEIEAMQDGVRALNAENIKSVHQEVLRLQTLIEDLHTLTNADIGGLQYRKEQADLEGILASTIERHQASLKQAGLTLEFERDKAPVVAWVDVGRIEQLMDNLLTNSGKYTDRGGRIVVSLSSDSARALIRVYDSVPGVPSEALGRLFEHLYRAEPSRNRKRGGSGLGLAICKRIVEAHQGVISARASELGGVEIRIELPLNHAGATN